MADEKEDKTPEPPKKEESSSRASEKHVGSNGPNGPMPDELKKWNWGAFFLSWIWGIGNSVWIALLCLIPIPFLGLIMMIVLGIKGNEWAWQNRHFKNVDEFKAVQKAWGIWGLILFLIGAVVLVIFSVIFFAFIISWVSNGNWTTNSAGNIVY